MIMRDFSSKTLRSPWDHNASAMKSQLQGWAGLLREWFLDACWQLFLTAPRQVAVDAPENRLALGLALVAGAVVKLWRRTASLPRRSCLFSDEKRLLCSGSNWAH